MALFPDDGSLDERRIARGLSRRDPDALAELYRHHGAAVFAYLVRTLRDRQTAEDVQQQVFAELWRRGDFDPDRASSLTWVMTIARSRAVDELRRRVPEPRDPHVAGELAGHEPSATADRVLEQERLTGLLATLPPDERTLLRMRFQLDLRQSEIAERTGIPIGTVKTRMARALERLREKLEDEAQ